eukprot:gene27542-31129_t
MNPFGKPPRPAKANSLVSNQQTSGLNPFDDANQDDDITIEFRPQTNELTHNSITNTRQVPLYSRVSENPVHNKHRPFHAQVQFEQPVLPPKPPRRVFGGSMPLSRDNSPSAVQLRAESRVPPYDDSFRDNPPPQDSIRSPFRFMMPSRNSYQPANRSSPGPSPRQVSSDDEDSSSGSSEEDENSSEGTDTTSGPSSRSSSTRSSAGLINNTGIELTTLAKASKTKTDKNATKNAKNKQSSSNKTNDTSNSDSTTAGDTSTKTKKKKKRKARKATVCVDPENENKLIRFLISERVYGYPRTYGGRCSNYYYYVLYNHPILSIFCTHKLHPFSKKHRFIVFLCSLSFAVCFAFILLDTPLVPT